MLGCTAPVLKEKKDAIVFVADGRFHLEAIMIANPTVPAFRYDPYQRILTREEYAHGEMRRVRRDMVNRARGVKSFGIVLGTLGTCAALLGPPNESGQQIVVVVLRLLTLHQERAELLEQFTTLLARQVFEGLGVRLLDHTRRERTEQIDVARHLLFVA